MCSLSHLWSRVSLKLNELLVGSDSTVRRLAASTFAIPNTVVSLRLDLRESNPSKENNMPLSTSVLQISLLCLVGSLCQLAGCQGAVSPGPEPWTERAPASDDVKQLAQDGNAFAFDLYARLAEQEGNLFFSPYSISTALGMTYAGARGDTETEMAETLHFTLPQERLHKANGALIADLDGTGKNRGYQLSIANRLWGRRGDEFLAPFLEVNRRDYGAEFQQLDFGADADAARNTINQWVEDQTNQKIKELLKPNVITGQTVLVLTNAIYFKGDWANRFKKSATHDRVFHVNAETEVEVPTMMQNEKFLNGHDELVQILEMPYEGNDVVMTILLPVERGGLAEVESQLSSAKLTEWLALMQESEIDVWLPKFKMTSEFQLNGALSEMGMPSAFDSRADLSGLTGSPGLYISAVVHKAFVDVNEEGTEAAAATAVVVAEAAALVDQFRADHPFLFLIRDKHTGGILFMGRVTDPSATE